MPDTIRRKLLKAEFKADASDPYAFTATISTSGLDRDREVLLPGGIRTGAFDASGSIFWNHDYDRPIAIPSGPLKVTDGAVIGKARFLERPDDHVGEWFPDTVRAYVSQANAAGRGVGVSVGYIEKAHRRPSKKDKADFGAEVVNVVTEWPITEWSIAPVQANTQAMVTAVGKGLVTPECVKALFDVDVATPTEPVKPRPVTIAVIEAAPVVQPVRVKHVVILVAGVAPRPVKRVQADVVGSMVRKQVAKLRGRLRA